MLNLKKDIVQTLLEKLNHQLSEAIVAMNSATKYAQSDEVKSESKWDTRGIEAGYLASAQKRRVLEIKAEISSLESIEYIKSSKIIIGSIIKTNLFKELLFLSPLTGGVKLKVNNQSIRVISLNSPLGEAIVGLRVNDEFEFQENEYQIISVI